MIVSLSGLIGSGKDTVADILVNQHGFKRESFASSLKDATASIFGWDREILEGKTPEARLAREEVDEWWAKRLNIPKLTPRWVLQYIGTDVLRPFFHEDIWVASLENKLRRAEGQNIVISDARFLNELKLLKNSGAVTIRVKRGPDPDWWAMASDVSIATPEKVLQMKRHDIHSSEWEWASYDFDKIIDNNGSLLDLSIQVNQLI
jgi:hypothetical protein